MSVSKGRDNKKKGEFDLPSRPRGKKGIQKVFDAVMKCDFQNKNNAKRFEDMHKDELRATTGKSDNVLHKYIRQIHEDQDEYDGELDEAICLKHDYDGYPPKKRQAFLKWALDYHPKLFCHQSSDSSDQNPLHLALYFRFDEFVATLIEYIRCEHLENPKKPRPVLPEPFREMLRQQDKERKTCLHLAVQQRSPDAEGIIQLYRSLPEADQKCAFKNTDNDGYMALHCAVTPRDKYNVELLIQQGPETPTMLDKRTASARPSPLKTPYGYVHDINFIPPETKPSQLSLVKMLIEADKSALRRLVDEQTNVSSYQPNNTPYQIRERGIHERLKDSLYREIVAKSDLEDNKERLESLTEKLEQHFRDTLTLKSRAICIEDSILNVIKLECLRSRDWDRSTVKECLYAPGKERHTEFSLSGIPRETVSTDYLKRLAKHLPFESVLTSVNLPRLRVESPVHNKQLLRNVTQLIEGSEAQDQASAPRASSSEDNDGVGINDLVTVFDWLWENNVKKIIKVVVVDDGNPSHSDQAIERALQRFEVEVWDWKKLDISSEVLYNASKYIREVSVYWSGNHATLMGWYSEEGFRNRIKFPKLANIRLYYKKGLETTARRKEYLGVFESKFGQLQGEEGQTAVPIKTELQADTENLGYLSGLRPGFGNQRSNVWMESMQPIINFLRSVPSSQLAPIKIAIIDDGVDTALDPFEDKIESGAEFPDQYGGDVMKPYFVSSSHHGTMMAYLILKLCPRAKLYIAKLDQRIGTHGRQHITPNSAAEAVKWAIGCGVDIISMSWSIDSSEKLENSPGLKKLQDAIQLASTNGSESQPDKRILMFCASSDQGLSTKYECYPSFWNQCIRVGSATPTGEKSAWVHGKDIDTLLPGEDVTFDPGDGSSPIDQPGSSVATAIAAGLTGMLVYFERLCNSVSGTVNGAHEPEWLLRDKHHLIKAFKYLAGQTQTHPFPRVDRLRGLSGKRWKRGGDNQEVCDILGNLFDNFRNNATLL